MVERVTERARYRDSAPLWGALLLSGGAWSLHLLVAQFAVEALCVPVASGAEAAGWGVRSVLLIVSLVTVLLALAGAVYSLMRRRSLTRRGAGLERSAGMSGVISALSLFFALLIILESVPLLIIGCGSS